MKRYNVCSPRPGKEKTFWHRVGTAFDGEKGMNIVFDSLPIPDEKGRVAVFLFEATEKGASKTKPQASAASGDLDDEIPFN